MVARLPADFADLAPEMAMAKDRAQELTQERASRQAENRARRGGR